jgi:hypothetical protein
LSMRLKKSAAVASLIIFISSSLVFPSSVFAQKILPVVDVGGGGCVMGGARDGRWLKAEEMAPLMKGGERYSIYSLTRRVAVRTGIRPVSEGAPCSETMYVKNLSPNKEDRTLIAVGGDWNALPRVPKVESTRSPLYRQAVADVLRRNGIARPQVKIVKVLRVDLEGDGTEEVLINATRAKRWEQGGITPDSNPGDYSVVLLRKVIKGKVQTIVLEGEYHPRLRNPETDGPPNEYAITGVLDLNGDGRMEIILQGGYYEGDWKTVYEIKGLKAESIFGCGCGA